MLAGNPSGAVACTIWASLPSAPRAIAATRGRNSMPCHVPNTGGPGTSGGQSAAGIQPRGFDHRRQCEPLAASDIDERAPWWYRIGHQRRVDRVAAELTARKLPRGDGGVDVAIGGRGEDRVDVWRQGARPDHGQRQKRHRRPDHRTDRERPYQQVAARRGELHLTYGGEGEVVQLAPPQPCAGLQLDQQQCRRHQWIRDIRRRVHLEAVEPQDAAN